MADLAVPPSGGPAPSARPEPAGIGPARLYARLVGADVRSAAEYPVSFALATVTSGLLLALELVAILAVFGNVDSLEGWSLGDALLLYGMAQTSCGLADLFVGHLDDLPVWIRTGRLDTLLLRPRPVLLQVLASDVDLRSVAKVAQGAVVLGIALAGADVAWSPAAVALLMVSLAAGTVIYAAIWVATVSVSFWLVDSREVSAAFTYGGRQFSSYPLGIYGAGLRNLARFVVPLAFTAYYPTLGLLDRADPLGAPGWVAWAGPGAALAMVAVAGLIWRTGVRSYRSVGA